MTKSNIKDKTTDKVDKEPQPKILIKSYKVLHKANPYKQSALFGLYSVYQYEYKNHVLNYWGLFKNNQIESNDRGMIKFSHFGSTKHINTQLNASYLQICLAQSCATLNNHLANISTKFSEIINQSSLVKNKSLLHQLRTINNNHTWLVNHNERRLYYYPNKLIIDDFGNLIESKLKIETPISNEAIRLAKKIFNYIVDKERVRFPNLNKPKLIIDDRLYTLERSESSYFDYWLKMTTLESRTRISIPIKSNDFFEQAYGVTGKTIELNFKFFDYPVKQHKHSSLSKFNDKKSNKISNKNVGKLVKVNQQVEFILNKKNEFNPNLIGKHLLTHTVSFDLGLCNLIAPSDGELYGKYWLNKLTEYDRKITSLLADRQYIFRNNKNKKSKIASKRYNQLIQQVRGFIKTEINRILNQFFEQNTNIKTIIIEKLHFTRPELSKKLNRIIQNFGLKLFKEKLNQLSLLKGFSIEELNPAYSSQECENCGYIDVNNRKTQSLYKCLCCKKELNADIQGARVNLKRFQSKQNSVYKTLGKGIILSHLKVNFINKVQSLVTNGYVCRRELYELLLKNKYFINDIKEVNKIQKDKINNKDFIKTTEASGVKPMTAENFDNLLKEYYNKLNQKDQKNLKDA